VVLDDMPLHWLWAADGPQPAISKPDHRHRGLLRARRERPRDRRAAEQRGEVARF